MKNVGFRPKVWYWVLVLRSPAGAVSGRLRVLDPAPCVQKSDIFIFFSVRNYLEKWKILWFQAPRTDNIVQPFTVDLSNIAKEKKDILNASDGWFFSVKKKTFLGGSGATLKFRFRLHSPKAGLGFGSATLSGTLTATNPPHFITAYLVVHADLASPGLLKPRILPLYNYTKLQ